MAAQGERVSGAIDMDEGLLESMAQDGEAEQEMLVVEEQEQFFPQMDPEPEMGAAAAAEYDTPPPLLRQIPSPVPSKTAHHNGGSVLLPPLIAQMVEKITQAMRGEMQQMKSGMDENAQQMREEITNKMDTNTNKMEANTNGINENAYRMGKTI